MYNTGVHVKEGDHITFVGKGEIMYWPQMGKSTGPSVAYKLLYRTGEKSPVYTYFGESIFKVRYEGDIYLGFDDGGVDTRGRAVNPDYYRDNKGYFVIDIIVWRDYEPATMSDFLEKASLEDPNNQNLKRLSNNFKWMKEVHLAQMRANEEVEKAKEAISALKGGEVSETEQPEEETEISEVSQKLEEEAKAVIESLKEKENVSTVDEEKERKVADLAETLQRALQSTQRPRGIEKEAGRTTGKGERAHSSRAASGGGKTQTTQKHPYHRHP